MFSKNEARPKYNDKVLQEEFEKEFQHINVRGSRWSPNPRRSTLAGKFYSIHDSADLGAADPVLLELIKDYKDRGPKQRWSQPVTENQMYGWFSEPLVPIRKMDSRFYAPRNRSISLFMMPPK